MSCLSTSYDRQGKDIDAEVLCKQCFDKQKVVIGESHPSTLDTMKTLNKSKTGDYWLTNTASNYERDKIITDY